MSGGSLANLYPMLELSDQVQALIESNDSTETNEYGEHKGRHYSPETIAKFKEGLKLINLAYIYAYRIDYLVSGDDGEEAFHERLTKSLDRINSDGTMSLLDYVC